MMMISFWNNFDSFKCSPVSISCASQETAQRWKSPMFVIFRLDLIGIGFQMNFGLELLDVVLLCILFSFLNYLVCRGFIVNLSSLIFFSCPTNFMIWKSRILQLLIFQASLISPFSKAFRDDRSITSCESHNISRRNSSKTSKTFSPRTKSRLASSTLTRSSSATGDPTWSSPRRRRTSTTSGSGSSTSTTTPSP